MCWALDSLTCIGTWWNPLYFHPWLFHPTGLLAWVWKREALFTEKEKEHDCGYEHKELSQISVSTWGSTQSMDMSGRPRGWYQGHPNQSQKWRSGSQLENQASLRTGNSYCWWQMNGDMQNLENWARLHTKLPILNSVWLWPFWLKGAWTPASKPMVKTNKQTKTSHFKSLNTPKSLTLWKCTVAQQTNFELKRK